MLTKTEEKGKKKGLHVGIPVLLKGWNSKVNKSTGCYTCQFKA